MRAINGGKPTRLAVRRPAAAGRGQALRRRRARLARRLAEAALCRQARHARPAVPDRCRAARAGRRGGGERRLPARDPRHRRRRQRAGHLDLSRSWPSAIPATAAGGSSMSRSSTPPTSRASQPAGIIASMQPTHQTSDRLMAEARLGPDRLERRLCLADDREARRAARLRLRLPGRKPQPLPRPRRRGQPAGHERPAAGRLAAARSGSASSRRWPASPAARPMPASPRTRSAASSPANGPTSSSSTATSARSIRRRSARTQVLETWVGGQEGVGARA